MQPTRLLEHFSKNHAKSLRWLGMVLVCFGAIVVTYWSYINNMHFSSDTFNAILDPYSIAKTNLRNGRIIHFLFYSLIESTGLNILAHERLIQLILAITCSICTVLIASRLAGVLHSKSVLASLAACVLVLFLFINPGFQTGWFYWPETSLGASLSIATCTLAILFWCRDRTKLDKPISFVLLIVTLEMYQVYLELYVGLCIAYSIAKNNFSPSKTAIRELATIVAFGVTAALINIILMKKLQWEGLIVVDERSATLTFSVLAANILSLIQLQATIAHDFDFGLIGIPVAIFVLLIIPVLANKKTIQESKKLAWVFACALLSYMVAFAPLLVSGKYWPAPRTYIGIYCFVIIFGIFALSKIKSNRSALTYFITGLASVLIVVSSTLHEAQTSTLLSNQEDNKEIREICYCIDSYASDTGIDVDNLVYFYDSDRTYYYPEVKYRVYDSNVRGMAYDWCFEGMMKYWGGFSGQISPGADDEKNRLFGDTDWDSLALSDQLIFDGKTAYLCIY